MGQRDRTTGTTPKAADAVGGEPPPGQGAASRGGEASATEAAVRGGGRPAPSAVRDPQAAGPRCPVNSHNEWDPLEEVIVGRPEGATVPGYHAAISFSLPSWAAGVYRILGGRRYPGFLVRRARKAVDEFIHILEAEGVTVRRPDVTDFSRRYRTPRWASRGFAAACPRDSVLVVGDEIIETPMAWRSRYFETFPYRSLFKEYFRQGARWTAAPRPELPDELYDQAFTLPGEGEPLRYVINEFEPVFDAADFVRCGRDLFVTRSNVTNRSGIEWLRRHLGDGYRIHEVETRCRQPMHIDTTLVPLAPGKVLVNPEYLDPSRLPAVFRTWDVLVAPEPDHLPGCRSKFSIVSRWISMNVLMLDERRVVVERSQVSMIQALKGWGFEPIACSFTAYGPFGGAFHCATLDVRRRGELRSYF
jgi:glycine amidinotransferase